METKAAPGDVVIFTGNCNMVPFVRGQEFVVQEPDRNTNPEVEILIEDEDGEGWYLYHKEYQLKKKTVSQEVGQKNNEKPESELDPEVSVRRRRDKILKSFFE